MSTPIQTPLTRRPRSPRLPRLPTTMPGQPDKVFAFQVALLPMRPGDIWIDNRHSKLQVAAVGDTFVFDLTSPPTQKVPPAPFSRTARTS